LCSGADALLGGDIIRPVLCLCVFVQFLKTPIDGIEFAA
jgi:hypothetical protein